MVIDRHGDLISANDACWTLVDSAAPRLRTPSANVARLLLHSEGLAPRIVNLDVWAWHVIDSLRQEETLNPDARLADQATADRLR